MKNDGVLWVVERWWKDGGWVPLDGACCVVADHMRDDWRDELSADDYRLVPYIRREEQA